MKTRGVGRTKARHAGLAQHAARATARRQNATEIDRLEASLVALTLALHKAEAARCDAECGMLALGEEIADARKEIRETAGKIMRLRDLAGAL